MLRKLKWQIPGEPLAARYNWCQGPKPGRGPAVGKHCFRVFIFCVTLKPQWDGQRKSCSFLLRRKKEYCCLSTNCVWPWNLNEEAKERVTLFFGFAWKRNIVVCQQIVCDLETSMKRPKKELLFFCFAGKRNIVVCQQIVCDLETSMKRPKKELLFFWLRRKQEYCCLSTNCVWPWNLNQAAKERVALFFFASQEKGILLFVKKLSVGSNRARFVLTFAHPQELMMVLNI